MANARRTPRKTRAVTAAFALLSMTSVAIAQSEGGAPDRLEQLIRMGIQEYQEGRYAAALGQLQQARDAMLASDGLEKRRGPIVLYLGLVQLRQGNLEGALAEWRDYVDLPEMTPAERQADLVQTMRQYLTVLTRRHNDAWAQVAVTAERGGNLEPPELGTLAINYFQNLGSPEIKPLAKGLAALLIADAKAVPGLRVVERGRLQAIRDEAALAASRLAQPALAGRIGVLLRAAHVATGAYNSLIGTDLVIDSLLSDTLAGSALGSHQQQGEIDTFYEVQKRLAVSILAEIGQTENELRAAGVYDRVMKPHTQSFEAFMSFSRGLDAKDRRAYDEAKRAFEAALAIDPDFELARQELLGLPTQNVSSMGNQQIVEAVQQVLPEMAEILEAIQKVVEREGPDGDPDLLNEPLSPIGPTIVTVTGLSVLTVAVPPMITDIVRDSDFFSELSAEALRDQDGQLPAPINIRSSNFANVVSDALRVRDDFLAFRNFDTGFFLRYGGVDDALVVFKNFDNSEARLIIPSTGLERTFRIERDEQGNVSVSVTDERLETTAQTTIEEENADAIADAVEEFLREQGNQVLRGYFREINAESTVAVSDGNPNATTARLASGTMRMFGDLIDPGRSAKAVSSDDGRWAARFSMQADGFKTKGFSGENTSVEASGTYRLLEDVQIGGGLLVGYTRVARSDVFHLGLVLGAPVTLARPNPDRDLLWTVTPSLAVGGSGSADIGAGGILWGGSLTSSVTYDVDKYLSLGMVNQFSAFTGETLEASGYSFDPGVSQQILRNGFRGSYRLGAGWYVFGGVDVTAFLSRAAVPAYATPGFGVGKTFAGGGAAQLGFSGNYGASFRSFGLRLAGSF